MLPAASVPQTLGQSGLHLFKVRIAQQRQHLCQGSGVQVPPAEAEEQGGQFLVKAVLDEPGGISAPQRVGRNVFRHHGVGGDTENVLFVSGLIVSIAGVSAIISSPTLGKIGDRIGNQKVLLGGLILSFICYIPMAFVQTPFQLGVLRFLLGFSTGALMPSINTLISKITPTEGVSRVYSYNQMCSNFGQVLGPMVGSTVAHGFGYSSVFLVTACFVLGNIGLSFFNFRKVLNKKL